MIYFVSKNESDKELIKKDIKEIINYLYGQDTLDELSNKYALVDKHDINNKELLTRIDVYKNDFYEENNNIFFKLYNIEDNKFYYYYNLINVITNLKSASNDSKYFNLFYDGLSKRVINRLIDDKEEENVLDEITELGLIAFSNESKIYENNDLLNSYLFNQKKIENKYNQIMGEGEFDKLDETCRNLRYHYIIKNNTSDYEYNEILSSLKKYFDLNISNINISIEDKEIMINNFNKLYNKLKNKKTL